MRVRRILANVALAVFALAAAFAFGEAVMRLMYKDQTPLFPRYHTDYHYGRYTIRGIRPNAEFWHTSVDGSWKYVTNSRGFRNTSDFEYDKPDGAIRIISLGDSHTQGYEVRQEFTFSAVLERFLGEHQKRAEVINAGVSGFSNAEALVFLENEGVKYHPDVVVLGFSGNDFEDNLKAGLFSLDEQKDLAERKYEHIPGVRIQNIIYSIPSVKWLSENSYFYSILFNRVWDYFKGKLRKEGLEAAERETALYPDEPEYAVSIAESQSDYQIDLAAALIERMQRFCIEHRIRLIVLDIPKFPRPYHYSSAIPQPLLDRIGAAGIEYISSESVLDRFAGTAEMHLPHGHHHISELTHTVFGIEIGRRILAMYEIASAR